MMQWRSKDRKGDGKVELNIGNRVQNYPSLSRLLHRHTYISLHVYISGETDRIVSY